MKAKRTDRPSKPAEPAPPPATPTTPTTPAAPVDLEEAVAGEEDPGASLDMVIGGPAPAPAPGAPPAKR